MEKLKSNHFEGVGLYIHFPFCVRKCNYCDFVSFPFKKQFSKTYFSYLKREIELFLEKFPYTKFRVETIYIGGGTPSLIEESIFDDFVSFLSTKFDLNAVREFTMEANPESISEQKFTFFRKMGVNRVSIGVQSFNNKTLEILGRVHTKEVAEEKFQLLRSIGFKNINIDLIFALPNETFEDQRHTLNKAISLMPEHISYYALMLERGTVLNKRKKLYDFVSEEEWVKEFNYGRKLLRDSGYVQYEISNYAKKGFESLHNLKYWKSFPYLGFGVSAGGFISNVRYVNVRSLENYYMKIEKGLLPYSFRKRLTSKELKSEFLIMGLRVLDGVDLEDYYFRFGSFLEVDFSVELAKLRNLGLIKLSKNKLSLTSEGVKFSNVVFREFVI